MTETTPLKDPAAGATHPGPNYVKMGGIVVVTLAIGYGLASFILSFDKNQELHDTKIGILRDMELQYLYLALLVLGKTILFLNFNPMAYKSGLPGNLKSNPFFYEVVGDSSDVADRPMIGYKNDGPIGMYNRSNRSIQNMVETAGGFFAAIGAVGWLFPSQTLTLVTTFCIGRILHQKGYAAGYGGQRIGFMLAMLSVLSMEGLSLIAFLKGQGYMN